MWLVCSFRGHRLALNSHSWVPDEGLKRIGKNCTQCKLKLIWTMTCCKKLTPYILGH